MTDPTPDDRLQIVEERLHVDKRVVETDRLRVRTVVDEHEVIVDDTVERGLLDIERVAFDREITAAPPPREEGDTIVISVIEERIELVKRLFLVEELRIRRTSVTEAVAIPAVVRRMRAVVERDEPTISTEGNSTW